MHSAGQPFALAGGANGKQGMLHAVLKDRLAGRDLVAATTHLKAKAGQVRIAMLKGIAMLCAVWIIFLLWSCKLASAHVKLCDCIWGAGSSPVRWAGE